MLSLLSDRFDSILKERMMKLEDATVSPLEAHGFGFCEANSRSRVRNIEKKKQ